MSINKPFGEFFGTQADIEEEETDIHYRTCEDCGCRFKCRVDSRLNKCRKHYKLPQKSSRKQNQKDVVKTENISLSGSQQKRRMGHRTRQQHKRVHVPNKK